MKSKLIVGFSSLILFAGCELSPLGKDPEAASEVVKNQPNCVWEISTDESECNVEYWLNFWSGIEESTWPERKKQIDKLSEQDPDVLRKILLSQGKSTPFQDRLRAQGWVESVLPKLSQQMRSFIKVALYNPSQDLLEMESALVTLSKINTQQSTSIDEQKIQLNKQQSQIDQLLNIEASIMESTEEEKE